MNVVVVGAGAVGMLVASFLSETTQVTLITRTEEQKQDIEKNKLIRINIDGTKFCRDVKASTNIEEITEDSLVIVALKYNQLGAIYPKLASLSTSIPLLFLQNGLAHYDEGLQLPHETIGFSSCQFGAEKINGYTVQHRGVGLCKIAIARGEVARFSLFHRLNNELFPVTFESDAERMLFEKAFLNCFINPLTAILQVKNGELVENQHTYQLLTRLYEEMITAFPEQKENLPFEAVVNLCKNTAFNTSSMLADRMNGRKTEADTIVGAVIKKAEQKGKVLPILTTFYQLICSIENSGETK